MIVLRDLKNKQQRSAFKDLQKSALEAGLKTSLPLTIKEYTKLYTGSKQFATSDYYYEWSKAIGKFYNTLGKKAGKVIDKNNLDLSTRRNFDYISGRGLASQLKIYARDIVTLSHVADPKYLSTNMSSDLIKSLVKEQKTLTVKEENKKPVKKRIITKAGIVGTARKPVTLATFGGSMIQLAYNNYLVALSNLGYTKTINYILTMGVSEWYKVFKANQEDLEPLYKYREFTAGGDDDIYYSIFSGEPLEDETGIEDEY